MNEEQEINNHQIALNSNNKNSNSERFIPWARFFARTFDLFFVCFLWVIPMYFILGSWNNISSALIQYFMVTPFIYLFFEPFCITLWGTTPGKYLYTIRVLNKDGSKLILKKAIKRSLQIYIKGNAFFIPIFSYIANAIAYRYYKSEKETPWDKNLKIQYFIGDISNRRILITNIIILILTFSIKNLTPILIEFAQK